MIQEDGVYYFREPGGELLARKDGSNWSYYHFDKLGSTRLLTDGDGDVTDKFAYDAYGALISHDELENSIDQPYQYVGQLGYYTHYQEPEFGLLQLGVRFYDAQVGRFTQIDPIKDGLNWYSYAEDSPILRIDPWGLRDTLKDCLDDCAKKRDKKQKKCYSDFMKCMAKNWYNPVTGYYKCFANAVKCLGEATAGYEGCIADCWMCP